MTDNKMRQIRIEKVTLNIGTGDTADRLEKALKLLNKIAQKKPVPRKTKKRIPTWGVRPGLEIGAKVTLRGKKGEELLTKLFAAVNSSLKYKSFDEYGNFSFGIPEYLSIPNAEYDPAIGIIGLEVAVTLSRPGFRIKYRNIQSRKIPAKHRIAKDEAVNFVREKFNVKVI